MTTATLQYSDQTLADTGGSSIVDPNDSAWTIFPTIDVGDAQSIRISRTLGAYAPSKAPAMQVQPDFLTLAFETTSDPSSYPWREILRVAAGNLGAPDLSTRTVYCERYVRCRSKRGPTPITFTASARSLLGVTVIP